MADRSLSDFRFAIRTLRKSPAFTAVVVFSLALGIGATSTIFSAINPILLRALPFAEPDRLMYISENTAERPEARRPPRVSTYGDWTDHNSVLEQLEFVVSYDMVRTIPGVEGAERNSIQFVSIGFFRMLGVAPILGRNFVAEDPLLITGPDSGMSDREGGVIISYGFWQRRFGGDPDILGRKFADEGVVVGIMPPGFRIFPWNEVDLWEPLAVSEFEGSLRWLEPIGRLKPGVSIEGAQTQLHAIARGGDQSGIFDETGGQVRVEPLHEFVSGGYVGNLYLLLGAASLVLLVACSNAASLLMGRAAARRQEITTRAALGAGRLRLMRQLLTEAVVLAFLGGALGVLMAQVGTKLFVILAPTWYLPAEEIRVDSMVLAFTLCLSLLTVVLFGMVPALRASDPDLVGSIKNGARGSAGGKRPLGRNLLVGSQIALTFVLLAGAALMFNSLARLVAVDRGFNPEHLLQAQVALEGERYVTRNEGTDFGFVVSPEVDVFYRELLQRLRALPGVEAAEMRGRSRGRVRGLVTHSGPAPPEALPGYREVSPGYLAAMGTPLPRGRSFTDRDTEGSPGVAIISEAMAQQYFPDEDPLGKFLQASLTRPSRMTPAAIDRPREIVGIVGDTREWNPRSPPRPMIYVPSTQHPTEYGHPGGVRTHNDKTLVMRTTLEPTSLAADLRRIVADLDPGVAVWGIESMQASLDQTVTSERFWMRALGIFATLALVLALVGIYGVVSYTVAQRTHEIGVRMALGAHPTDVLRMVLRQGMVVNGGGVIAGVLAAVAATRLLASWLYGVEATDPATFAAVAVALLGIALLATCLPARDAARVDPVLAMKSE